MGVGVEVFSAYLNPAGDCRVFKGVGLSLGAAGRVRVDCITHCAVWPLYVQPSVTGMKGTVTSGED